MVGSQSLLLVLGVVLLLFGGKKLPELAGALGKSMKEFKHGAEDASAEPEPAAASEASVEDSPSVCVGCKTTLQPGWAHCPVCGAAVKGEATPTRA